MERRPGNLSNAGLPDRDTLVLDDINISISQYVHVRLKNCRVSYEDGSTIPPWSDKPMTPLGNRLNAMPRWGNLPMFLFFQ